MDSRVRIFEEVELSSPTLVAAWPGMGLVGIKTIKFLSKQLPHIRKIAEIAPEGFFSTNAVQVEHGLIRVAKAPKSEFHLASTEDGRDILIFRGEEQPAPGTELQFARLVIDVALHFNVKQVMTAAAMVTNLSHSEPSKVWVAANKAELLEELPKESFETVSEGSIGGLNGLLLAAAKEKELDGICLMGEIPSYVTNLENPKASMAILEFLSKTLHVDLDLSSIKQQAIYVENQIDSAMHQVAANVIQGKDPDIIN